MKVIHIVIMCVCFLYMFLTCNKSNADPLDDIDRTILETMRGNQRADTVNNKQKENKPIIREDKNEDEKDRYGEEIISLQRGDYRATVNVPKNWYVYKHNKNTNVSIVHKSKRSAVIVGIHDTNGMSTHKLCSKIMKDYKKAQITLSLPEYCSFKGIWVDKNGESDVDVELYNDGKYYTNVIVAGIIAFGREVSYTVRRSSTR